MNYSIQNIQTVKRNDLKFRSPSKSMSLYGIMYGHCPFKDLLCTENVLYLKSMQRTHTKHAMYMNYK